MNRPKTKLLTPEFEHPEKVAVTALCAAVWPEGDTCTHCGSEQTFKLKHAHDWGCHDCHRMFSVTDGTPAHRSSIPLHKWLKGLRLWASEINAAPTAIASEIEVATASALIMRDYLLSCFKPPYDRPSDRPALLQAASVSLKRFDEIRKMLRDDLRDAEAVYRKGKHVRRKKDTIRVRRTTS